MSITRQSFFRHAFIPIMGVALWLCTFVIDDFTYGVAPVLSLMVISFLWMIVLLVYYLSIWWDLYHFKKHPNAYVPLEKMFSKSAKLCVQNFCIRLAFVILPIFVILPMAIGALDNYVGDFGTNVSLSFLVVTGFLSFSFLPILSIICCIAFLGGGGQVAKRSAVQQRFDNIFLVTAIGISLVPWFYLLSNKL